jgi:hypothetical protein
MAHGEIKHFGVSSLMENEEERRGGRRGRRQAGKQVPDGASKLMSTVVFCARYIAGRSASP